MENVATRRIVVLPGSSGRGLEKGEPVEALDVQALFVDLGPGLAYNEVDEPGEETWYQPRESICANTI